MNFLGGSHEHEQVSFFFDRDSGYRGIIAIHSTVLGPAVGGTRLRRYASDAEALEDVLRLSQAMSYKASISGLDWGGGKSVIIAGEGSGAGESVAKREALFRAHGRHIESLGGRYVTAEDVGTVPEDMESINATTDNVVGLPQKMGNPAPITALGTFHGLRACAQQRWASDDLSTKTAAVQGLGNVGYELCALLAEAGVALLVADVDGGRVDRAVEDFGARAVEPDAIYDCAADIFCPCALGGVINDASIDRMQFEVIAGAANNQLQTEEDGDRLHELGVVYAPDFVINCGGLIMGTAEWNGWSIETARKKTSESYDILAGIFGRASELSIPAHRAANQIARDRIEKAQETGRSRD